MGLYAMHSFVHVDASPSFKGIILISMPVGSGKLTLPTRRNALVSTIPAVYELRSFSGRL